MQNLCGGRVCVDVVGERRLWHPVRVALANELDAIERFDVCSRLLNNQVVDRHVVLGVERKLFKTQKDFVEPNAGVLSQKTQVHLVKRWAVANQHGGFALVFVVKRSKPRRHQ